MATHRIGVAIVGVAGLAVFMPVIWGYSTGAITGVSGGPAGFGGNCTRCHPFNMGTGHVDYVNPLRRYRAGQVYDLTVHIADAALDGAGFEISAESLGGHEGTLIVSDAVNTRFADGNPAYVTHTAAGLADSRANWVVGGSYDYHLQWQAPNSDVGPVTLFTAASTVDDGAFFTGTHYYATHTTLQYVVPGDEDGDTDVDLADHAQLVACLLGPDVPQGEQCQYVDTDGDGNVDLADAAGLFAGFTGPTATVPGAYVLADAVRGGLLYDKWWRVNGAPAPAGDHPLWGTRPDQTTNTRSGSATWRCKECHGWDYKGKDGAYALPSSHHTGFGGIFGTVLTPQEVFDLIKTDHEYGTAGMSDQDIWDLVKMALEGVIDTDSFISPTCAVGSNDGGACTVDAHCPGGTCTGPDTFVGDMTNGQSLYDDVCASCHGFDGRDLDFGGGEFVGTVASGNPWEFLHKVRFGHPASPMPAFDLLGWSRQWAADVGVYSATLPAASNRIARSRTRAVKSQHVTRRRRLATAD